MFVERLFCGYWRYLLALVCGCAVITTGPSCVTGSRNGSGTPLLIITSISSSNISDVGATITWRTNRMSDSHVEYGISTQYGNVVSLKTMDTSHRLNVFGLTPDTLYHYRVKSKDEAGNLSTSGDLTFTTGKSSSPPDFALSANPPNLTINRGANGTIPITTTRSGGFTGSVSLSASGLPSGVTASFGPGSTTNANSTLNILTLTASSSATLGAATVTVTGTGGGLTRTTTISLTVNQPPPPNFTLSANPTSLTINRGASGTCAITVTRLNGFTNNVTLIASGLPSGVTASFNPTGTGSVLTLAASSAATLGGATVTVTGTGGGLTRTATINLTVNLPPPPDFTLSANPTSLTINRGSSGTSAITITRISGFAGSVLLSASGAPSGVTASFNQESVTGTSSTLTLTVSGAAAFGAANVTVTGTGGGLTRTTTINLTVPQPGFALSANPASLAVNRNASGTSTIAIARTGGFTGSVTLSASGAPSGVTASFNPASAPGTSSALTLTASNAATIGPATVTITGTGGGLTRTATISLTVINPQDMFSLAPYTGPFGEEQARILFDRFGFGAPPERIAQAMNDGLDVTVTKLTTWQSEGNLDGIVADWVCDGWLSGKDNLNTCSSSGTYDFHNKFYANSKLIKFLHSPNQYFYKLILFLHDERLAGSALTEDPWFMRHAYVDHWNMLLKAANGGEYAGSGGDYKQFMRDWMKDSLGHVFWQDGEDNKSFFPNENFAREFWELGTVGTTALDGTPNYSDFDIANAARVHTGYSRSSTLTDSTGQPYQIGVYKEADHAPGAFDIFVGTPYYAKVSTQEQLLQATFNHPRTAEHLAEDLWKEFINPQKDPNAIRELAQIIRNSGFNLTQVMRVIMRSRALYAPGSKETLIKQPIELVIGLLRSFPGYNTTHIHSGDDYTVLTWHTGALDQTFFSPNSIFGWDDKVLAGASYIKIWRDVSNQLLTKTVGSNAEHLARYSLRDRFWTGLSSTDALIDRLTSCFNVPLNSAQRGHLKTYLDTQPRQGASAQPSPFPNAGATQQEERIKGAVAILINQPSYRTK
jgi:Protein of unknown function (DUF1800)